MSTLHPRAAILDEIEQEPTKLTQEQLDRLMAQIDANDAELGIDPGYKGLDWELVRDGELDLEDQLAYEARWGEEG